MPYNPNIHHRRSIRLKGYDYSQAGLYFITICVQDRARLFGKITDGQMICNDAGTMVENEWLKLRERFTNIQLHQHIVMPNHFHAILEIVGATLVVAPVRVPLVGTQYDNNTPVRVPLVGTPNEPNAPNERFAPNDDDSQKGQPKGIAPTVDIQKNKTVGDMVGAFQSIVTVEYIRGVKNMGWTPFNGKLLQRNYYEHIIRDEKSYHTISKYIINNPAKWDDDKFYLS